MNDRAVSPVGFVSVVSSLLLVVIGIAFILGLDSIERLGFAILLIIAFLQVVILDAI